MKRVFRRRFFLLMGILLLFLGAACRTVPKESEIDGDLQASELIQLAQNASDAGRTAESEVYYSVIRKRFYDDLPTRLAAEFELAHIKVKQKNYTEALPLLQGVLAYYEGIQGLTLPAAYHKLALLDLAKIPEHLRGKE